MSIFMIVRKASHCQHKLRDSMTRTLLYQYHTQVMFRWAHEKFISLFEWHFDLLARNVYVMQ